MTGPQNFQVQGYELVNLLGAGTTGELWLARAQATGEQVALKRLRLRGPQAADQARRLVTLLSMIDHPHLQRVREAIPQGPEMALVLDYADGGNLDQLLSGRGGLDPGEVVTTIGPIAEALAAAHERGLVHGDISPESILYMTDGRPMLGDVGVFPLVAGPDTMIMHGFFDPSAMGQPGGGPNPASDVYSLAAVCYTALTGIVPQPGQPRRPLPEVAPNLPQGLVHAVEAGMQQQPERRPTTAQFADLVYGACPPEPVRFPVGLALSDADIAAALAKAGSTNPAGNPGGDPAGQPPGGPQGPPDQQAAVSPGPQGSRAANPPATPAPPPEPQDPFAQSLAGGMPQPNQFPTIPREIEDDEYDDGPRIGLWIGIAAAVLLLAAGGVGGWWWWQNKSGTPAAASTSGPTSSAEPSGQNSPAPQNTEKPPTTKPDKTTPNSPVPKSPSGKPTTKPSDDPVDATTKWRTELDRLDKIRSEAFATPDPNLINKIYVPTAQTLINQDKDLVDRYVLAGAKAVGLRYQIQDLTVASSNSRRVVLDVVDQRQAFTIINSAGQSEPRSAGPKTHRTITLTNSGGEWLISAILQQ